MIAIKARYLKHGEAIGKDYVFACNFLPKLGDIVFFFFSAKNTAKNLEIL